VRTLGRTYVALMDERRAWQQRIHAQLFHQGVPPVGGLLTSQGRSALGRAELSPAGRAQVDTAFAAIDGLSGLIVPLRAELVAIGRREPGPAGPPDPLRDRAPRSSSGPSWAMPGASAAPTRRSASRASMSRSGPRMASALPGDSPAKARRSCAGRSSRRPRRPATRARPTMPTTPRSASAWAASGPRSRSPASSSVVAITPSASWVPPPGSRPTRRSSRQPDDDDRCVRSPPSADVAARSWQAPVVAARGGRPGKIEQPRTPPGYTPSAIMSPGQPRPADPDKAG
jgi:hypothetical protein